MTMQRFFFFALLTLAAAQAARANCGNGNGNGQGCTQAQPIPSSVVSVTDMQTTSIENTNTNTNFSSSSSRASSSAISASMSGVIAVSENTLSAAGGQGGQGGNGYGGTGGSAASSVVFNAPCPAVSMAYAPPVQATATCAIPLSAGLSFINFGGSFGTAYVDQNCALLEQVRAVAQLGDTETAFEMLCASKPYATARERQGRPCRK